MTLLDTYKKELGIDNMPSFFRNFLNVPSLIRLKNIDYFCGMKYASSNLELYHFNEEITRYDHSLTTSLITWKLTNDMTQTIAALYHDIATPCFSHTIDYMNKDYVNQESTEEYTAKIINGDFKLYQLLEYYGIKADDIINFKKYPVVDNKRPKLCADRLDGIISTGISWTKSIDENDIKNIVNDIDLFKNEDNELEIGFNNEEVAKIAYDASVKINEYTHKDEDTYMLSLLAKITKLAIKKGIISYNQLYYITEDKLLNKLKNCNDEEILDLIYKFQNIKINEINLSYIPEIKDMNLNPLVKTKRLNK